MEAAALFWEADENLATTLLSGQISTIHPVAQYTHPCFIFDGWNAANAAGTRNASAEHTSIEIVAQSPHC